MAEMITLHLSDGDVEAYLARPDDEPHPGVLLFMDAIGLRPQIAAMADRIASWGYVVLAPNVFFRSGTAAETTPSAPLETDEARTAFFRHASPRVAALTSDLAERDIPQYLVALRALSGSAAPAVGVTGYCMGARLAVRAAGLDPDVVAVGGFHGGRLVTDADDSPHLSLSRARAAFVFGHADHDSSMTVSDVAALGRALDAAGLDAVNEIYPEAPHGYTMADTSSHQRAGAERHFAMLRDLFVRTLG